LVNPGKDFLSVYKDFAVLVGPIDLLLNIRTYALSTEESGKKSRKEIGGKDPYRRLGQLSRERK
jgi:hypothetical protein